MQFIPSNLVGRALKQPTGYYAYFPHKLFKEGPKGINFNSELLGLLSEANRALGELNGITRLLENPDLFIGSYVQKEALLSSQIEGTQCSLEDVFLVEEDQTQLRPVDTVINYIKAMNLGLDQLQTLPFSTRLVKKVHAVLLSDGVRGNLYAGEFKTNQNWIGHPGVCLMKHHLFHCLRIMWRNGWEI